MSCPDTLLKKASMLMAISRLTEEMANECLREAATEELNKMTENSGPRHRRCACSENSQERN